MEKLEWNSFTKKIHIYASLEKLYYLWGSTEGITSWFLRHATYKTKEGQTRAPSEFIQKGDMYTWQWYNWDGKEEGKVLEANGTDYIEVSFESSKVSIRLEEKKQGSTCNTYAIRNSY